MKIREIMTTENRSATNNDKEIGNLNSLCPLSPPSGGKIEVSWNIKLQQNNE
jgi:hypothetical protein